MSQGGSGSKELKISTTYHGNAVMARGGLTARQQAVIEAACRGGYFDIPKRINQKQLAESFGVSVSTLCEILQRAEKKVISGYLASKWG